MHEYFLSVVLFTLGSTLEGEAEVLRYFDRHSLMKVGLQEVSISLASCRSFACEAAAMWHLASSW